jgi:hypothetical protein
MLTSCPQCAKLTRPEDFKEIEYHNYEGDKYTFAMCADCYERIQRHENSKKGEIMKYKGIEITETLNFQKFIQINADSDGDEPVEFLVWDKGYDKPQIKKITGIGNCNWGNPSRETCWMTSDGYSYDKAAVIPVVEVIYSDDLPKLANKLKEIKKDGGKISIAEIMDMVKLFLKPIEE